jgi:hypothetical protein
MSLNCRFCGTETDDVFADLGMHPPCESYVPPEKFNSMEAFYPLKAYVCPKCFLVQLDEYVTPEEIFTEYAYFSSYSDDWLAHVKNYTQLMIERFNLTDNSKVVEVASNDGYLLQYFVEKGIPVLGIEPAKNVAKVAIDKGIPTKMIFFNHQTAPKIVKENGKADLIAGNNVLAQVPNLNSFVQGLKILLNSRGIITIEFPHLMRLTEENQFDTIYHEHFCYFSFYSVNEIFKYHGLMLFDVDEIPTHGGSLRIYACHQEDKTKEISNNVTGILQREKDKGYLNISTYQEFHEKVKETKRKLLDFLIKAKREKKRIAGYGAPGKGNTLLNYCGIMTDFIDFTVDRNPYKQGKVLPGSHIPIFHPDKINQEKPDYVLILPWNFKDEIIKQMAHIRTWGGKFVVPIPEVRVIHDF